MCRCFFLAQSYSVAAKYAEAYLLFKRAGDHAQSALKSFIGLSSADEVLIAYSLLSVCILLLYAILSRLFVNLQIFPFIFGCPF